MLSKPIRRIELPETATHYTRHGRLVEVSEQIGGAIGLKDMARFFVPGQSTENGPDGLGQFWRPLG